LASVRITPNRKFAIGLGAVIVSESLSRPDTETDTAPGRETHTDVVGVGVKTVFSSAAALERATKERGDKIDKL
jgi:hypothetical protein